MTLRNKRAFTLIELLVVVAMIAIILGAMTTSVSAARERARIQKATSEVKILTQAILAAENWSRGGQYKLEPMSKQDADANSLGFLLGGEQSDAGDKIPVMLMAQLKSGGKMTDPWGTPYRVTIKSGNVKVPEQTLRLMTGFFLPNFYRLGFGERE